VLFTNLVHTAWGKWEEDAAGEQVEVDCWDLQVVLELI